MVPGVYCSSAVRILAAAMCVAEKGVPRRSLGLRLLVEQ
jgi:hypothetical protein